MQPRSKSELFGLVYFIKYFYVTHNDLSVTRHDIGVQAARRSRYTVRLPRHRYIERTSDKILVIQS